MKEFIRDFLLETHENLAQLDLDLLTLEKDPGERETLARVFRTLHTVKGTAGCLGLTKLQGLSHAAENLLSRIRDGEIRFSPEIATVTLSVVDAIRTMLANIEATQEEGTGDYSGMIAVLERLTRGETGVLPPHSQSGPPASRVAAASKIIALAAAANGQAPRSTVRAPEAPASKVQPTSRASRIVAAAVQSPATVDPAPAPAQAAAKPVDITQTPPPKKEPAHISPPPGPTMPPAKPLNLPPGGDASASQSSAISDSSIRVDVGLLDKLMNLVGELVLARNQVVQFSTTQEDVAFLGTVQRLNLLTTELQAGVMKTRMQPIGNVWGKFPRLVRDLAVACAKQVRFEMDGQETELDKTIIEAIRDPLTHMVRNAVDHGIESPQARIAAGKLGEGRLLLHAFHEGGKVIIEIKDDGGGIDPERVKNKAIQKQLITPEQAARMSDAELVNLVFLPGFSTADKVTHFSGRGVGMDVVRTNIEKIGGTVDITSKVGRGTTVKMKIPLTLAIIPALTVTAGGDRYAIPQVSLLELVRVEGEQAARGIELIHGAPVYRLRGNLLPLVYLDKQLQVTSTRRTGGEINIVVLQADDRQFGLVVDDIHDTEEIVVKPLQKQLKGVNAFAGATIMGDGRVALILDVLGLAQRASVVSGGRERARNDKAAGAGDGDADQQTVLLFANPNGGRMAVPLGLVSRLEEFPRAMVERVGGREVVQYRGEILPLLNTSKLLRQGTPGRAPAPRPRTEAPAATDENIQVVVHVANGRRVGLVVGQILDIVETSVASRAPTARPGVLFTAVVQDRVTEFLDVESIIHRNQSA